MILDQKVVAMMRMKAGTAGLWVAVRVNGRFIERNTVAGVSQYRGHLEWSLRGGHRRPLFKMNQGYRAACALAGVDEWGECNPSIITPKICELLQLG